MAIPDLEDAIEHLQQEDLEAAIASLEEKIEELPAHLTAHVLLARAYEAQHEWEQSLKSWENVRFLMPNSPVGREGKQRVLGRLKGEPESTAEDESPGMSTESEPADQEADDETPPTATETSSELDELRRRAEQEARQGGARSGLSEEAASSAGPTSRGDGSSSTPEDRVDELEREDDDLDRLIDELESARIEPRPDVDDVPPPDLETEIDDLVSETLARIHEAQDQYREAAQIYVKLASQEPAQARTYLEKAAEMREKAEAKAQSTESE